MAIVTQDTSLDRTGKMLRHRFGEWFEAGGIQWQQCQVKHRVYDGPCYTFKHEEPPGVVSNASRP